MKMASFARFIFYILLVAAPFSTRYIFVPGIIADVEIEPGTFSLFGTQLLALIFIVSALLSGAKNRLSRPGEFTLIGAGFLFSSAALSVVLSGDARGLVVLSWLLLGVVLAVAVNKVRPASRYIFLALAVGGIIQSVFAANQFIQQTVSSSKWLGVAQHLSEISGTFVVETAVGRWLRAYGTLPHPNMLGAYLVIAVIASMALTLLINKKWRVLAMLAVVINVWGLSLTLSRSALLALTVGLIFFVVMVLVFFHGVARRRVLVVTGLVIIVFFQSSLLLLDPFSARVLGRGRLEHISIESRLNQLADVQLLLRDQRLFGVGSGLMPLALHEQDSSRSPWDYQYVHNVPLLILVETGVPGLLFWLIVICGVLGSAKYTLKHRVNIRTVVFSAVFLALLTGAMFDHFLWTSWFGQLIFWSMVGLLIGNSSQNDVSSPE
ncbi:O-antigen ligase family protein [Patescibacteria group bacterium]|nr:O-antigen ligase family protein [Patescibacteria group bacterium]